MATDLPTAPPPRPEDGAPYLPEHRLVPAPCGDVRSGVRVVQPVEVSVDADVLPDLQNVGDGPHELNALVSDRFGRSCVFTSIAAFRFPIYQQGNRKWLALSV